MNDKQNRALTEFEEQDRAGFLDLLAVLAKHRKLILGVPVAAGAMALVIALLLPPTYRATASILPPQQAQMGAAALLAQLGGAASAVASVSGMKNPADLYIGMMKSRTVADRMIKRFSLLGVYDTDSIEKARKELELNTSVNSGKEGLITVMVDDGDKVRAANMANAYIEELTSLTRSLAVTEAAQRRLFFERQLEQAKNKLASAEVALKQGFEAHGVVSVDGDSRAIVETIARVRAQVSAKEIQLNSMRQFVTTNNHEYKQVQQQLNSMRAELNRLENGQPSVATRADKIPGGLENIKTLREVKYQQMLYELLAKQYEAARLDEARESSVIQVLDPAVVPEKVYSPKPLRLAVITMLLALFAVLTLVYVRDAIERSLQHPSARQKLRALQASAG